MAEDVLAPLMFVTVFAFVFSGYPVAFSLGGTALIFAAIGIQLGVLDLGLLNAFPLRVFGILSNTVLLAVPFFVLMGTVLERSKLAEDLLVTMGELFGAVRGGLALAVVVVGTLLAAATGVVGASVVAMGVISLPVMLRHGYSPALSSGVICASGTLGQIVPPSIVLVVLGDQLGVGVGDLFVGALRPGLLLAGMYGVYVLIAAWGWPSMAPALPPPEGGRRGLLGKVVRVMIPPLLLVVLVLGSIFAGLATPTDAGAVGAIGAIGLALVQRRLSLAALREAVDQTTQTTSMVMMLLVGSTMFALVFRGLGGDLLVEDLLTDLPGGKWGLLVVANLAIFVLGFFIDFFEIAFILLPLLVPAARAVGIDLVWFGVLIGMNLQTSFLTPPFGFALFYLRGVAPPEVTTTMVYRGVAPFIAIQVVGLAIVALFPELVTGSWW